MARQIKSKSCCEQAEKSDLTSGTNFLGIVKNVFKLNQTRPEANTLPWGTDSRAEHSGVTAIQAQIETAQAQFRRLQMIQ